MFMKSVIFLTKARTSANLVEVHRLIASLRAFGGELANCPVWVFAADPLAASGLDLEDPEVRLIPLNATGASGESVFAYEFGDKVCACARAEELAQPGVETLVWVDPSCLIVNPPRLYSLNGAFDAALRPVHHRNVGLLSGAPLDAYWGKIFAAVGKPDIEMSIQSFADNQCLRAYFNTHAFALDPARRLMLRWLDLFTELAGDTVFQERACQDELHRIFLHQAVLSALIAATIPQERIRILPPSYNYPYNLHANLPPERRAQAFGNLVTFTYEGRDINPQRITDIAVDGHLRSWLADHVMMDE